MPDIALTRSVEELLHVEKALDVANELLFEAGIFGIIPSRSVSFREGRNFHKQVRDRVKEFQESVNGA